MKSADGQNGPFSARAVLIDPGSMTVLWANEATSETLDGRAADVPPDTPLDRVLPTAATLGVPEALRAIADSGVPRRPHADVVSTARRSVTLVVSIYRLPDGTPLLLSERARRFDRGTAGRGDPHRSGGRPRTSGRPRR